MARGVTWHYVLLAYDTSESARITYLTGRMPTCHEIYARCLHVGKRREFTDTRCGAVHVRAIGAAVSHTGSQVPDPAIQLEDINESDQIVEQKLAQAFGHNLNVNLRELRNSLDEIDA